MDIIIKNVTAITMDRQSPVIENAAVAVRNGKIAYIGQGVEEPGASHIIDGKGKIVMPGLVNTHSHVAMSVMRGFADDYNLQEWLSDHVFPTEAKLDAKSVEIGAMLGMAEMIRTGTVSFTDMYFNIPNIAQAALDAGMYANLSNGALSFDKEGYDFELDGATIEAREMLKSYHGAGGGRIRLDASIHAEYTSFDRVWEAEAEFAKEHGLNMHLHLSETRTEHEECIARYGKTPCQVLAEHGIFDTRSTAAHCVWVTGEDIELLAQKGVTVAHNPVSNLKLGSGIAPVRDMLARGVNVALGTDGVCSNNSHDLFEEIKLAAILQKGVTNDPKAVPADEALRMATVNGAASQGREGQIGKLKEGFDATLIMIDTDRPSLLPVHNPVSTLAYSAKGGDVCMTMARGKILYQDGEFKTLDIERIKHDLINYVMPRVFGA